MKTENGQADSDAAEKKCDKTNRNGDYSGFWKPIGGEWKTLLYAFARPFVILTLIIAGFALHFANDTGNPNKKFSMLFQIIATVFTAIAGGFIYDALRNFLDNNLLVKKGRSAVRQLSLVRQRTKNILDRVKNGGKTEEIGNLLSFLEKDIANATQEWNDVFPGVGKIEEAYTLLEEKEKELGSSKSERDRLFELLEIEKRKNGTKVESLEKELKEKDNEIRTLSTQVKNIRSNSDSFVLTSGVTGLAGPGNIYSTVFDTNFQPINLGQAKCERCGKDFTYWLTLANGANEGDCDRTMCPECAKIIR